MHNNNMNKNDAVPGKLRELQVTRKRIDAQITHYVCMWHIQSIRDGKPDEHIKQLRRWLKKYLHKTLCELYKTNRRNNNTNNNKDKTAQNKCYGVTCDAL